MTNASIMLALPDDSLSSILSFIVVLNAAVLAQTLLYGIHIVLFVICVYILVSHRRSAPWYSLGLAFLMFALSTADIALTIRLCVHNLPEVYLPGGTNYLSTRLYPKNPFFVANNFLATVYLLHRCYMVWDRTRIVLLLLGFLLMLDTVWGFLAFASPLFFDQHKFVPVYIWSIFSMNVIITAIIVGRIFWVSRWARPWIGERQVTKYHVAIAILMESSTIYSACLLGYMLYPQKGEYRVVVISICMRLVSIMPTLVIVQVGLARMDRGNGRTQATVTEYREDGRGGTTGGVVETIVTSAAAANHRRAFLPQEHDIGDLSSMSSSKPPSFDMSFRNDTQ